MKSRFCFTIVVVLLFYTSAVLPAQTPIGKTIPDENDSFTEYYILEEKSDSTECYLYLFQQSRSYMLLVNYHIAPQLIHSYFLSQGTYTDINQTVVFMDDTNDLIMKAKRNEANDLVFDRGLDFMKGEVFAFAEKTSQLPGPPYSYTIFPEEVIQAAINQAKTAISDNNAAGCRYQTTMFSDHILADLRLNEDQTFAYQFMHYSLVQGQWLRENRLITLASACGTVFYGTADSASQDFAVIQLPGFIFEAHENHTLYGINK